ncbi:MAG: YHS domain-containing protein [Pedobacter sp.]|nr:MAG: YHS domain-containing protein [Pedobacter sp.]
MKKAIIFVLAILCLSFALFANDRSARDFKCTALTTDTLKKDSTDPVCGMKVKAGSTKTILYQKTVYGFCSESCKKRFNQEPKKYIKN